MIASTARADTLGVVADGDDAGVVRERVEAWAQDHGLRVVPSPMSRDAARTLANCFVVQDRRCAAGVVDKRGHADDIVYLHAEKGTLAVTWLRKHRSPQTTELECAPCSADDLAPVLEKLSTQVDLDTGVLELRSKPDGLDVTIDEETAGTTPLERELPVGSHDVALFANGERVAHKTIALERGQQLELTLAAEPPHHDRPRWPLYMIGAGVALVAVGGVLYATSEQPTGARPTYRNTQPAGIVVGLTGVVVAGGGVLVGWGRAF